MPRAGAAPLLRLHLLAPGLAVLGALLGGCASLSESECTNANWDEIGYRDGTKGVRQARSIDHSKACAKHGVEFDEQAYFAGYERGLEVFCTDANALKLGMDGSHYAGTCSVEKYPTFDARFRAGRIIYDQRQVVNQARNRIGQLEGEWNSLRYDYEAAETREQRSYIRERLRQVEYEIRATRDRIYYEEQRLRELMQKLDASSV